MGSVEDATREMRSAAIRLSRAAQVQGELTCMFGGGPDVRTACNFSDVHRLRYTLQNGTMVFLEPSGAKRHLTYFSEAVTCQKCKDLLGCVS